MVADLITAASQDVLMATKTARSQIRKLIMNWQSHPSEAPRIVALGLWVKPWVNLCEMALQVIDKRTGGVATVSFGIDGFTLP